MKVCIGEHEHKWLPYFTRTRCLSCCRTFPGPFHCLSFAVLKYTLSPDTYFVPLLVLILLLSIRHIFSEFSHTAYASLPLYKGARLSVRILLVLEGVNTGGLSRNADSSFGFYPRASWKGENPWTFACEVLAFRYQDKARSRLKCDSSSVLSIISAIMKLCLSARPLLNGYSAAVTFTVIFMASHIFKNSALANSPPLQL